VVTETTTGTFTVSGNAGDQDSVTVNGTAGNDTIAVTRGATTTVLVNALQTVSIAAATTPTVVVATGLGTDATTVNGTGGPANLTISGGQTPVVDTLTVNTTSAGNSSETPGATNDAGTFVTPDGTTAFTGMSTVAITTTATGAAFTASGTNANDTITAQNLGGSDRVWVNAQAVVTFGGFATLNLAGKFSNDTFVVTPGGMSPDGTAALTSITVAGVSPTANDVLLINGTTGAAIGYTPTAAGAGTVTIAAAPSVAFTNVANLSVNGQGGGDVLTVTGPSGATFNDSLGSAVDTGTIQVNSLTPLAYSNLGAAGSIFLAGTGGADHVNLTGPNPSDTYTVAATTGQVTIAGQAGTYVPITPTQTGGGTLALVLSSPGGSATFNVSAPSPYVTTTIFGNSGATGNAVANLTGNGAPITVTEGPSGTTVVGGGLGTVTVAGTGTVNVLNTGAVTVMGTAGQQNNLVVTSTATGGSVQDNGLAPIVNVTTMGTFTVAGTANDNDTVTLNGTGGNDSIVASGGSAAPVVRINSLTPLALGANLSVLNIVETSGNNNLTVNSTAGAFPVPIDYNGGPGTSILTLVGGTATSDTYTPGPGTGMGTSVIVIGGVTQQVNFSSLTPVFDNVAGPLTVQGTNGNDAIAYRPPTIGTNQGLVSINNLETIEFGSKTSLTINTLNGTDAVSLNNTTAQTGLTSITVNGGNSSTGDTLTVTGTTGTDTVSYTPTGLESGNVVFTAPALPPIAFTNVAGLAYDGQGGGDTLTVNSGVQSNARFTVSPGSNVDSGTVQVNTTAPLSYKNLGSATSVANGVKGTGEVAVVGNSNFANTLDYVGHDNSDTYTVAPTTGAITSVGNPGLYTPVFPTAITNLILAGAGGSNTFNITAPVPYTTTAIQGGTPASSSAAVANVTGNGTSLVTAALGGSSAIISGGGLGTLTFTGTQTVNLGNGTGAVQVTGTASPDDLVVTPTGANSASVQNNGLSPLVNVTTTAVPNTTALTVAGNGGADTIQVNGTGGPDTIGVVQGTPTTTVTVTAGPTGYLPVNVSTPNGNNVALVVGSSTGKDTINVSGSGGPATLLTIGGSPTGLDTLGYSTSVAGTTTVTASSTPGAGTITTPGGSSFGFAGIGNIVLSTTAAGSTLTVLGSNGNDAITAQDIAGVDSVSINSQPFVTFTGYTSLNLNGQGGNDTFAVSPVGMALTTINVNGVGVNDTDTLTVNGSSGADVVGYTPTGAAAGKVAIAGAPAVVFTNVIAASYNGQGGGDTLTVTGTQGNDALSVTPGATFDSGSVLVNALTPFSYSALGAGEVLLNGNGGTDALTYTGQVNGGTYTVAATGAITSVGTQGTTVPVIPSAGFTTLHLVAPSGSTANTFNLSAGLPYTNTTVTSGSSAGSSASVVNLTGNGSAQVTIALGNASAVVTGGGLNTVTITGNEIVNVNNGAGKVLVTGAASPDDLVVTPTGANSASVQNNGLSPVVNVTTTATPNTGVLTVAGNGGADVVQVNGTGGPDTIGVVLGQPITTVTVTPGSTGYLPVNVSTPTGNDLELIAGSSTGHDTIKVSGTVGPANLLTVGGTLVGLDTLTVTTAGATTVTASSTPGAGLITTSSGTFAFAGIGNIVATSTAGGTLTILGSNGNDAITAQDTAGVDSVSINGQPIVTFAGYANLTLNGQGGNDTFNISPANMAVTSITVTGNQGLGGSLTVNGTAGLDTVDYTPTSGGAGSLAITTEPTVTFTGIGSVSYNGNGGNDQLTVTTPAVSFGTAITFTPGATANQGNIALRVGAQGMGGTLLAPLSYTNIDKDGTLVFDTLNSAPSDALTFNGVAAGDEFQIGGDPAGDQILLTSAVGAAEALAVSAPGISALVAQGVGNNDIFAVSTPVFFPAGVSVLGGGPNATAFLNGDGSGPLTISPQYENSLGTVSGDGLGVVFLGNIATAEVNAGGASVLFSGTSTGLETDYTPIAANEGLVAFPGSNTLFDVFHLAAPLAFDEVGSGNLFKVLATTDPTAFNVTQAGPDTIVATTDSATSTPLLSASIVSTDTSSLVIQGGKGNDVLTVDSTAGPVLIPITFDGGGGANTLDLTGGTAASDTYTPGPAPGAGTSVLTFGTGPGAVSETVNFVGLVPVFDNVAGPITVVGTNGNDAIAYDAPTNPANQGLVSINNLETIEFGNKTGLTINTLNGTDAVSINNTTAQTGLVNGVTVNGGDPSAGDTLVVSGTSKADDVTYTPTGLGSGTVAITPSGGTALPLVTFTNMGGLSYNGQGGSDSLTVVGTQGNDNFDVNLGNAVDAGSVLVNSLVPLSYSNLGTGEVLLNGNGGTDVLSYSGHDNGDVYTVSATGEITSIGNPGQFIPVIPTGFTSLYLVAPSGSSANTFNLSAGLPYANTYIISGSPAASSASVVNLTGDGTPVTVALSNSSAIVTGGGLHTVTITGNEIVDVKDGAGAVTVTGTASPDDLVVTPTGANSASVQNNGLSPVVNVTTTAVPNTNALTVQGNGGADVIQVNGTGGPDNITAALGTPTTVVTVVANSSGYLPVNVSTPTGNDVELIVGSSTGHDTINVTGSGGPNSLLTVGGSPVGLDTLTLTTATTGTTTVVASSTPGAGVITLPNGQNFGFSGIGGVSVTSTATGVNTLNVVGSNGNNAITAQHLNGVDIVAIDSQPLVTFAGYSVLDLNGAAGHDTFDVSPQGMAVSSIVVNGIDPNDTDTLTVNGTSKADAIAFTPTDTAAGTVAITPAGGSALAPVTFTNITGVTVNGQGGGDSLTVNGTTSSDAIGVTLGNTVDSGSVLVNSLVPLTYTNLGAASNPTFGSMGTGEVLIDGGGGTDTLTYTGNDNGDTYTVAPTTGAITSTGFPGLYTPVIPTGIANLHLIAPPGSSANTFNLSAPVPYTSTFITSGSPANSSATVANLTGDGTPVTVTMSNSSAIVTGGGLHTVTITGTGAVNLNDGTGLVTVTGTTGAPDNLFVTPTGADTASVQDGSSSPVVNVTTTATATMGILTVAGNSGDQDTVTVNGTSGNDTIAVVRGIPTTVTVTPPAGAFLPITVATPAGNTLSLVVSTGLGNDAINVSGTGGPANLTVQGTVAGTDTLSVATTTGGTTAVTPGPTNDSGSVATPDGTTAFAGVDFVNVSSTAAGAGLVVRGTNGDDTITAQHLGSAVGGTDKVWVNSQAVTTFSGYTTLTLDGRFGNDSFNVSPQNMAVTSIAVTGENPNATGQLIVNGTSAEDAITYTPTGASTGSVAITPVGGMALPPVTFSNLAGVSVNGQGAPAGGGGGGGDTLTVNGTQGSDAIGLTLGATVDSGQVLVNSFTPLTYSNLGTGSSPTYGAIGTGEILLNGNGGTDSITYAGHSGDTGDTFTVAAGTGAITSFGFPGLYTPVIPTNPTGTMLLYLSPAAGSSGNTFNLSANLPYTSTFVTGGSPGASSSSVVNLTGDGSPVTVTMGPGSSSTVSGGGLGSVTVTGAETVNLKSGAGTVDVTGTTGAPDNITVTPTSAKTASFQDNGLSPVFNLTTTAVSPGSILTISGNAGDQSDIATVIGTPGNDTITAIGALANNADSVTVAPIAPTNGLLPINLLGLAGVVINSGLGNDNVVVNSSIGPFQIPLTYDGGAGIDTLTLVGGTATADQYIPGPDAGEGNLALTFAQSGTESVSFSNLSPVLDSVAGPLTVTGTNANNTITYSAGSVITNGLIAEDNFESIEFTNKTILTINGGGGDNTTIVNNPNTPTGLVAINVTGGTGNNTLIVNAQDKLVIQSDITAAIVNIPGATPVPVGYTNTANVKVINSIDQLTGVPLTPTPVNAPIVAVAGVTLIDVPVADFYFTDQPPAELSTPADFAATINWGDGTPPTGGVITQLSAINGVVNFQVSGTHAYAAQGSYQIQVTVTDLGSTRTFLLNDSVNGQVINAAIMANPGATTVPGPIVDTVAVASSGLITSNGAEIQPTEGQPFTNAVIATFTDTNPGASVANYPPGSIKINWGDGTPIDTNATVVQVGTSPNGTIFEVLGSHTYVEEGVNYQISVTITRYTTINNVSTPGSTTVALNTATVLDAPLSSPPQVEATKDIDPNFSKLDLGTITEGIPFTAVVATFNDANPLATVSDFNYVTIDWGDGSPMSSGIVIQPGGVGTTFEVLGTHTYANANSISGPGDFPTVINVHDKGGSTILIGASVTVNNLAINLNGKLNPSSDSGQSNSDAITFVTQPNFFGTATVNYPDGEVIASAGADITLYATPVGGGSPFLIGQTEALSDGSWSITSNVALAQGKYIITAYATQVGGFATTSDVILPNANQGPLTIDTAGPKVTNVSFAKRVNGEVLVSFQDNLSGMNLYEVQDAANYILTKANSSRGSFVVNVISQTPNNPTGIDTVVLKINDGRQLRGGNYLLTILSGGGATGIRDIAGNALDGEFYGYFPSGNNIAGGNFVAELNAVHHTVFAPRTIIGKATPVSPPGTPSSGSTIPVAANPNTPAGNPGLNQAISPAVRRRDLRVVQALKKHKVKHSSLDTHDTALDEVVGSDGVR
jgi:hypothetical protein